MLNHALIMAAGRGMRMMPLTNVIPKPLAFYKGTTLIGNAISSLKNKIGEIYITVGYKGADLARYVIGQGVSGIFNTEGKGNCWWLFNTPLKWLDAPLLVMTCDNVAEIDVRWIWEHYLALGKPLCMMVPVTPVPGIEGDYITHSAQRVISLSRQTAAPSYASGIQVLNPAAINRQLCGVEDFYQLWPALIQQQQLYCSAVYPLPWYAVDTLEQLDTANK